jgi:hypothetical protein
MEEYLGCCGKISSELDLREPQIRNRSFELYLFVCLFVLSRTSNFSAIWRLSPLPVTGLLI